MDIKNNSENPKVSIIIPVYNGSDYLSYAIDCAINQTYENIEVIVIDDGSSDDGKTKAIALSYGNKISYFHKENGGVSSALNYGIEKMTGDYFSWLSHDDGYSLNKIESSVNCLRKYDLLNKRCMAYTDANFIDEHGKQIKEMKKFFKEDKVYSGKDVVQIMIQKGTLNGCCMLIPKRAFEEVGTFNEILRYSQDSLMWYQMFLAEYSLVFDGEYNVESRLHKNQVSQRRRDLFEHDAKYIAEVLKQPLFQADLSGALLKGYTKRLMKYRVDEAVKILIEHLNKKKVLSKRQLLEMKMSKRIGAIRYLMAKTYKKVLFMVRH